MFCALAVTLNIISVFSENDSPPNISSVREKLKLAVDGLLKRGAFVLSADCVHIEKSTADVVADAEFILAKTVLIYPV